MIQAASGTAVLASSAQAWVTLFAAIIAAGAAIVAAIIGGVNASKSRQWVGRDQWWRRFSWAIDKSISVNPRESELGLSVLIALIDVPWAKNEDNEWVWLFWRDITRPWAGRRRGSGIGGLGAVLGRGARSDRRLR